MLKSCKGKLIAGFRHKNANVQVGDKTLSWPEAVCKCKFMHMGLSQMEARILRVTLHQKLTSIISVALRKEAWRQRKDYYNIKVQMKCFFNAQFERVAKIRRIAVYRFLISSLVSEL